MGPTWRDCLPPYPEAAPLAAGGDGAPEAARRLIVRALEAADPGERRRLGRAAVALCPGFAGVLRDLEADADTEEAGLLQGAWGRCPPDAQPPGPDRRRRSRLGPGGRPGVAAAFRPQYGLGPRRARGLGLVADAPRPRRGGGATHRGHESELRKGVLGWGYGHPHALFQ